MDSTSPSVLLVDDEPTLREPLAEYLAGQGFSVSEAESAAAARAELTASTPDIVLLDIMMPGIDGYEVCRRLKSELNTRHIPIIFVTAKISPADELEGLSLRLL